MGVERNVRLLAWHNFFTDFKLYAPVAILYYAQVSGSYALGMSVFSIVMLTQAVLEIPTGVFSDLIGRKKTVVLGSLAITAGTIAYAVGLNYWWLVVGALFEGAARAFYSGNNDALLHDTVTELGKPEEYADTLGKLSSLFQAALAVSAILGSVIAHWSFAWVMWVSVLPQIGGILISVRLGEPKQHEVIETNPYRHFSQAFRLMVTNATLRWLALASIVGTSAGEAMYLFNAAFIKTLWPVWAIGVQKALANGGAMISFLTAGRLIKRYSEYPVIVWSRIYGRVTSIMAYATPTVGSPLLLASHSLFYGSITVAENSVQQQHFSPKQRATMASLISLGHSMGTAIMTVIIGALGDRWGPTTALLVMQIFPTIPLLIYWYLWRNEKKASATMQVQS